MPPGLKRLPQPLVDFHVHRFPDRLFDAIRRRFVADCRRIVLHPLCRRESVACLREDEIDTLLGLDLSQSFCDAVFRDNGLRLVRECSQMRP